MSLAENLRRRRLAKKLSQAALSKAAGVSQQSISQLERGIDLTSKKLPAIAVALGCQLADLDESYSGISGVVEPTEPTMQTPDHERLKARLADLFADLMQTQDADLHNQVARFLDRRLKPYRHRQMRHTSTKQPS